MEEEAEEEAEAEEVPRRDPSEKQEPHTVMWGKTRTPHSDVGNKCFKIKCWVV